MSLTNNLKKQIDLPVWEWMRFAPVTTSSISSLCYGDANTERYMYYFVSQTLYRYDTYSDSWQLLSNSNTTALTVLATKYSTYGGYRGNILAATNNTVTIPGLKGNTLAGYKIRITAGTGIGQERTISTVSDCVIQDYGILTATTTATIVDNTKKWKINQWVGYQVRLVYGTGSTIIRKVLYNDATTLYVYDVNYQQLEQWNNTIFVAAAPYAVPVTTAGSQAQYYIESSVATVDTNWTINPDATSSFVVLSGGIWALTSFAGSWAMWQYYDILSDTWYNKTSPSAHLSAVLGTEISMERTGEVGGVFTTGTISSATIRTATTASSFTDDQYCNYQIRITAGTGLGQIRRIVDHTTGTNSMITVDINWETIPDNTSTFSIYADTQKITVIGNGGSTMLQYNVDEDQWTTGASYDAGVVRNASIQFPGQEAFGITTAVRQTTSITVLNATPTAGGLGYAVGDISSVTGGTTLAHVRVESITLGGVVTSVSLYACGNGYTTGSGKATVAVVGTGSGLTVNITTVGLTGRVTTASAHNFLIGDSVTVKGATESAWNTTYTVLGTPAVTIPTICEFIITATADLVATASQTTTLIVDSTANWTAGEHIGKLVTLTVAGTQPTSQVRRITANTATTLTVATIVAGGNGTSRYIIQTPNCFGRDIQYKLSNRGATGHATGGSSTTLVDNTKSWLVNQWMGYKIRILAGTGMFNTVGDITIISNDATTLTLYTPGFTPDATTEYQIMDSYGPLNGAAGIRTLTAAPVAGGSGYAVGDQFTITGGTAIGVVLAVNAGVVTSVGLSYGGVSGYSVATAATSKITGSGNNALTVAVAAITAIGSTTALEDNTKNWTVNQWAGKRVRITSGTGQAQESTITANTATTLTFTAVTVAPDSTSTYCILSIAPRGAGCSLSWIYGGTDTANKGRYLLSSRGGGANTLDRYNVSTELWDYTLTFQPQSELLNTGTMYAYDGVDKIYYQVNALGRIIAYDVYHNTAEACSTIPYGMGAAVLGNRMEIVKTPDGLKYLYIMRHTGNEFWRTLIYWE